MTLDEGVRQLAEALRRAAEQHGRPNTFGPGELEQLYGGPPAMMAGRIGASLDLRCRLWQALGGREGWGSAPRYDRRRFAV
jgi:hypothetical protein